MKITATLNDMSFSLAVIFIIRLFSTSAFRVLLSCLLLGNRKN